VHIHIQFWAYRGGIFGGGGGIRAHGDIGAPRAFRGLSVSMKGVL